MKIRWRGWFRCLGEEGEDEGTVDLVEGRSQVRRVACARYAVER